MLSKLHTIWTKTQAAEGFASSRLPFFKGLNRKRREKSDLRELRRVYRVYKDYIIKHGGEYTQETREKLMKARAIASVLFEVLSTVTSAAGSQALADADHSRSEFYVPYNILPLDQGGVHQAIMQLPEIKCAIAAVRNVRGLPFLDDFKSRQAYIDLFDWLQFCFEFQKGNVANQREHLILLLANTHVRKAHKQTRKLEDGAVDELMKKFFKNYTDWCKFLGRKSNIRLPYLKQEAQQYKLLYIALYLLIWGEAANLRFMPECLCYIFHHMASELHGMLTGAVSLTTGEIVKPAYGGKPEAFLTDVVCPIYEVICQEAMKNRNGTTDHSTWRNYDDLNEFFWSPECFELGWPMNSNHDFFFVDTSKDDKEKRTRTPNRSREEEKDENVRDVEMGANVVKPQEPKWLGKTNFSEIRSFWQVFRSFDRMWSFLILSLQAMIIMASHELDSPLKLLDTTVLEDVMSIFITSAVLKLIQAILDVAFKWKTRRLMDSTHRKKDLLKIIEAIMWTIVLPIYYSTSRRKYTCYSTQDDNWIKECWKIYRDF
ncbi:glucan synthase-like 4 [Striga asiatica]|uniref:Glucan synthase-like 4 n=1 Tax=Striga asiatica TaxID=4170 RepID=A0A5A7PLN2_STRAF|nr:glucan synthase-like 4 [Striga asiatica]